MTIRRILVALDASSHSLAALEAAADMAARVEAELVGLFVEDINLLRLASLPFAQEVGLHSALRRGLDTSAMERTLKLRAARAREAMLAAAERTRVRWSFQVARGSVTSELLAAAEALHADLLALGKASDEMTSRWRLGSTALSVLARAPQAVLLLQRGMCVRGPVLALNDQAAGAAQALATAVGLAQACGSELVVLSRAGSEEEAQRLETQAQTAVQPTGIKSRYRRLVGADVRKVVQVVETERPGALVVSAASSLFESQGLQQFVERISCPVFLIR